MKRVVAVTGSSKRGLTAYLEALGVCLPDVEPLLLLPGMDTRELEAALSRVSSLLVTGGVDIHPSEYGEEPSGTELEHVQPERDSIERRALDFADAQGLPVLAICRGMQMLNVQRGGALLQDIGEAHRDGRAQDDKWMPFHDVAVAESRLSGIVGANSIRTNSRHHQALDPARLGRGLVVTGCCPADGIVEAVEAPGERYVVGVQWHPENMALAPEDTVERRAARALFTSFGHA
jgi:putative glutamine amidotransferase